MNKRASRVLPNTTIEESGVPPQSLKDRLKAGYLANANESRSIAEEWLPIEPEVPDYSS